MAWLSKVRYKVGFIIPTLLVYCVYIILPIFVGIAYSFTRYSGIGRAEFIGWSNYRRLIKDRIFWISIKNTAIIFVVASILLLILSFLLALLLNQKLRLVNTSRALIFSPAIIAPIIVGIVWVYILDPKIGVINAILRSIGAEGATHEWIGGTVLTPYSIAFIYFWQQLGYLTTIFIAGLKQIPDEILEAAKVDGANWLQEIWHVIIPSMRATFSTVIVLIITGIFKIFEIVQQTTGGGPNHMSDTLVTYSYSITFQSGEYGYGMSLATVTFLISLAITALYFLFDRRRG